MNLYSSPGHLAFQRGEPAGEVRPDGEAALAGLVPPGRKIGGTATSPRYTPHNLTPAYSLHYDWTGWPMAGTSFPECSLDLVRATVPVWERDGLRFLEAHATSEKLQIRFSVIPSLSPAFFCMRARGRLQYALRIAGVPVEFRRKVSFRSLGENTSADVAGYLQEQVGKEGVADARFEELLRPVAVACPEAVLSEPMVSSTGRYWYNLHVVLVVADRFRITNPVKLGQLRDGAVEVMRRTGGAIAALSVMPDHLHVAVRGHYERSPQEIALALQNGCAQAVGCRVWKDGFYVGTFSDHEMGEVRRIAGKS